MGRGIGEGVVHVYESLLVGVEGDCEAPEGDCDVNAVVLIGMELVDAWLVLWDLDHSAAYWIESLYRGVHFVEDRRGGEMVS